jgi:G3E family GTPase
MQIALNMLMIKAKPDRLLIEPTGLGHPKEVIQVLSSEHYKNVIQLENTITLVDARHFNSQKHLSNETFQQQLEVADLLVINKSDLCSKKDIDTFKSYISTHSELKLKPYLLTKEGNVGLGYLNTQQTLAKAKTIKEDSCVHSSSISPIEKPSLPDCGFLVKSHRDGNFTSVGWRIKADKIFDIDAVYDWIKTLDASRIKAVLNSKSGFISLNISSDHFNSSDPIHKKDKLDHNKKQYDESRLEIIFEEKELNDDLINAWTEYFLQL